VASLFASTAQQSLMSQEKKLRKISPDDVTRAVGTGAVSDQPACRYERAALISKDKLSGCGDPLIDGSSAAPRGSIRMARSMFQHTGQLPHEVPKHGAQDGGDYDEE
jgi:hypothetical protein